MFVFLHGLTSAVGNGRLYYDLVYVVYISRMSFSFDVFSIRHFAYTIIVVYNILTLWKKINLVTS